MFNRQVKGILELQFLSNAQKVVLITLNSRIQTNKIGLFTYGDIAAAAGVSIRTVRRSIKRLIELNLILINVHISSHNQSKASRRCVYRIECMLVVPEVDRMIQRLYDLLCTAESPTGSLQ
jgi:DNA-binding MarR family transcriptional regulator